MRAGASSKCCSPKSPLPEPGDVTGYTNALAIWLFCGPMTLSRPRSQLRFNGAGCWFRCCCGFEDTNLAASADRLAALVAQGKIELRHCCRGLLLVLCCFGARRQAANELAMVHHVRGDVLDNLVDVAEEPGEIVVGDELRDRIGPHLESLAEQHLDPAVFGEQLLGVVLEEAPGRTEQVETLLERVGYVHLPHMIPERVSAAPRHLVMGDDEVTHVLIFGARLEIIFVHVRRRETCGRKHRQKPVYAGLNQVDAGRLKRLEEARREADGDDVLVPRLEPASGPEPHRPGIGRGLAVEVREQ